MGDSPIPLSALMFIVLIVVITVLAFLMILTVLLGYAVCAAATGVNAATVPGAIAGYDALLEFQDHKPFECVGEGRESRAAMAALAARPEWREDALVKRFVREILPALDPDELAIEPQLVLQGEHRVPAPTWGRVRAHFDA